MIDLRYLHFLDFLVCNFCTYESRMNQARTKCLDLRCLYTCSGVSFIQDTSMYGTILRRASLFVSMENVWWLCLSFCGGGVCGGLCSYHHHSS
jgi:hypothetical protein